jgi:hypothetical protein
MLRVCWCHLAIVSSMTMAKAAATVSVDKSKSNPFNGSSNQRCMCSWKKPDTWPVAADLETKLPWCEYLRQIIAQHADDDDVWNGDPYKVTGKRDIKQCSDKVVALRMSLQHHVPGFKDKSDHPHFIVARHHSPRALLEWRLAWNIKSGTTFLSKEQAASITKKDLFGSRRFTENCNKVSNLLAKARRSPSTPADGNKFIQAPVATKIEVEEIVKTFFTPSTLVRLRTRKERVMQTEQKARAESVEKPTALCHDWGCVAED